MVKAKASKASKIKKKKWIKIFPPKLFGNNIVGEIPVFEPSSLVGKKVKINLMSLTRDIKKQNINLKIIITKVDGENAHTDYYGYYLNPSSMKRIVRRGKEKLSVSAIFKTADNKKVRINPLIIPFRKIKGSVSASLKKAATEMIASYASKTTLENLIRDLISTKLQKTLKSNLKKIYPIKIVEVAKLHIETGKKKHMEAKIEETKPEGESEEAPVKEAPKVEQPEIKEAPKVEVKEEITEVKETTEEVEIKETPKEEAKAE